MAKDWESIFRDWAKSPPATEQTRCNNAVGIIRRAVSESDALSVRKIEVFAQGSYRNRTNVKADSDVDVCVLCRDCFYFYLPQGAQPENFGITRMDIDYQRYKADVGKALASYLGKKAVLRGNRAFNVNETTYHVDADAVACFEYRLYEPDYSYREGTAFMTDSGIVIKNWPQQNYDNGVAKNENTQQRFKAMVRILKNIRNEMEESGHNEAKVIPSYLIECSVWNVPNEAFANSYFSDDVRNVLIHIYNRTLKSEHCKEWTEINDIKYLFRPFQPWQYLQLNQFILKAWNYIGFKE